MLEEGRVVAYVDGFNLYYGLLDARLHKYKWLDVHGMCASLIKPEQTLEFVRYFTSRIRRNPETEKRQGIYIRALSAIGGVEIDYGSFLAKTVTCRKCGTTRRKNEEKKTDVNISVRLLGDAHADKLDTALLISADSDLVPPIEYIREHFRGKEVIVATPPERWSTQLNKAAHGAYEIPRDHQTHPHDWYTSGSMLRSRRLSPHH